jgi:hypothetical protein
MGSPRYSSSSLWQVVTRPLYRRVRCCPETSRLFSEPMIKSLLKLAMVLGVLAAIGVATGVINVKFKPLG